MNPAHNGVDRWTFLSTPFDLGKQGGQVDRFLSTSIGKVDKSVSTCPPPSTALTCENTRWTRLSTCPRCRNSRRRSPAPGRPTSHEQEPVMLFVFSAETAPTAAQIRKALPTDTARPARVAATLGRLLNTTRSEPAAHAPTGWSERLIHHGWVRSERRKWAVIADDVVGRHSSGDPLKEDPLYRLANHASARTISHNYPAHRRLRRAQCILERHLPGPRLAGRAPGLPRPRAHRVHGPDRLVLRNRPG